MPSLTGIAQWLGQVGYDPRLGPMGSVTLPSSEDVPRTIPLAPLAPGVVFKPQSRNLTPEEVAHEGVHVGLGLPGAIGGKLGGSLLGTGTRGAYLDPDEVAAYMSQPLSKSTSADQSTIGALAKDQGGLYGKLVEFLTGLPKKLNPPPELAKGDIPSFPE